MVSLIEVEVNIKTGDGGFDGKGILLFNDLISVPVIFECKRYKIPISSEKIRNFRGAMTSGVRKGLFITTSSFTRNAIKEAKHEGKIPIDLIDGGRLIDILKKIGKNIGLIKEEKIMKTRYRVNPDWFKTFQKADSFKDLSKF